MRWAVEAFDCEGGLSMGLQRGGERQPVRRFDVERYGPDTTEVNESSICDRLANPCALALIPFRRCSNCRTTIWWRWRRRLNSVHEGLKRFGPEPETIITAPYIVSAALGANYRQQKKRRTVMAQEMTADVKSIFKSACKSHWAVELLIERYLTPIDDGHNLDAPIFTNMALAAELQIKCIRALENDGEYLRGHDLEVLFNALDGESKAEIERLYEEVRAEKPYLAKWEAAHPKVQRKLDDILSMTKDAFESWRYEFEEKDRRFWGVEELVEAMQRYILNLRPDWKDCVLFKPEK